MSRRYSHAAVKTAATHWLLSAQAIERSKDEWNRRDARRANGTAGTLKGYKALFLDDGQLPVELYGEYADDDHRGGTAELGDDRR